MTPISDEIRKMANSDSVHSRTTRAAMRDLADRIDTEMVELPRDRDGVPIHVGDTVYGCRSGMKMTISELRMTANGWSISTSSGYLTDAEVTHKRPDSWEDIADELDEIVDSADAADDNCEKLADLADQELVGAEHNYKYECKQLRATVRYLHRKIDKLQTQRALLRALCDVYLKEDL